MIKRYLSVTTMSFVLLTAILSCNNRPDIHFPFPGGKGAYGIAYVKGGRVVYFNDIDSLSSAIILANQKHLAVYVADTDYNVYLDNAPERGFVGPGTIRYDSTLIYKNDIDFVGIPQNMKEQKYTYPDLINTGDIISPPVAQEFHHGTVDILAHWYNDFGLMRTALSKNKVYGSYVWYDWSWNFSSNADYDPSRHPLLGWYSGDNKNVLDWICYWLVKYGIRGVILDNDFGTDHWSDSSDYSYWYYQLFNHVKNFNSLKYSVWIAANFGISKEEAIKHDSDMIYNVVAKYPNVYCYKKDGKNYPVFYAWDMEGFRGTYDNYNGHSNSVKRLKEMAQECKGLGYDGICVLARDLHTQSNFNSTVLNDLKAAGVYLFSSEYSSVYANEGPADAYDHSYSNYVNNVSFPDSSYSVINVLTSAESHAPHPSKWLLKGSTPFLFKQLLQEAVNETKASDKPQIVTIYNVSEWAEGGSGLIPNQKDLFGYLEAVSRVR